MKPGTKCKCGSVSFRKETDILDVWFDSGVSHASVLAAKKNQGKVQWPADLLSRGERSAPRLVPDLAAHGRRGTRSRALQARAHPRLRQRRRRQEDVEVEGQRDRSDGLRLEVGRRDPAPLGRHRGLSQRRELLARDDRAHLQVYRKVRNTFRYILGNIYDFDPAQAPGDAEYCELDQWALHRTEQFLKRVREAYESDEFHLVYHALVNFCATDLSALYFDILKDRLYTSPKNSREPARRRPRSTRSPSRSRPAGADPELHRGRGLGLSSKAARCSKPISRFGRRSRAARKPRLASPRSSKRFASR